MDTLISIFLLIVFAVVMMVKIGKLLESEPCKKVPFMAYLRHSPKNVGCFVGG